MADNNALAPAPKRPRLEAALIEATAAVQEARGPFTASERDALVEAVESCAQALWRDADAQAARARAPEASVDDVAQAHARRRRPPSNGPDYCRMALRLSMSAGALRNVPTREIARACSWLSPKDLASLVSLSCWRLTADPHGLGALTVSLSVAENCRTLGASWVPPPKQNVLQPLAVIAEADRAVGDGARCLAALDALRRDCGRAHRTARDALSTFKRTLFGRQAPSNEDASDDLGALVALSTASEVGAASTLSRRVRALGSLVTRCAHDAADAPSIQALLDAGVPEALKRACDDADDSDDGVDAASEAVQAASTLLRALPASASSAASDRLLKVGGASVRALAKSIERGSRAHRRVLLLCDACEQALGGPSVTSTEITSETPAWARAARTTVARSLVADERFETIAHAALNRADCAQRLATVLSRVASGSDARAALASAPRCMQAVERLARAPAAAGAARDALCDVAAALARATVAAARRAARDERRTSLVASPSPEHYQICDTYAPDSDASDPGPKPNLRKPRADWAVIGKLEFSDDGGDGAQP